jgi:phospholipase C
MLIEPDISHDRSHSMDRVVLVLFEDRSFDNVLGHLYRPEDGKTFEGVIGKNLSNRSRTGRSTAPSGVRCPTP